jgi:hypothetical protein
MKTVISVASVLACAFSSAAQITATLNPLPDGSMLADTTHSGVNLLSSLK